MKSLLWVVFFLTLTGTVPAAKIVCYYESWAAYWGTNAVNPEDIDVSMCTHINYAFVGMDGDGNLEPTDSYLDIDQGFFYRISDLKAKNGNLKVLFSVQTSAANFAQVARDGGKRARMVSSARQMIEQYNYDGIDIDWEAPGGGDRDNFISLLQDLRNDFGNGWLVTAAVMSELGDGYDARRINDVLDHVNIMTYDMYGSDWSDYTGQNSALYASSMESDWERDNLNMASIVQHWLDGGISPNKLIAGLGFYGRTFRLRDPGNHGIHAPISGGGAPGSITQAEGSMSYLEICEIRNDWECVFDDEQKNPYCWNGDQWIGFDDPQSIAEKANFINSKGLGGAMIWSADQDDIRGRCGQAWGLLNVLYENLN